MSSVSELVNCSTIVKAIVIYTHIYILFERFFFPQSSDWTSVDHHEALVALSNWRYFHLTEKSIQLFIFYITSMHMHPLCSYMIKCQCHLLFFLKHRIKSGRVVSIHKTITIVCYKTVTMSLAHERICNLAEFSCTFPQSFSPFDLLPLSSAFSLSVLSFSSAFFSALFSYAHSMHSTECCVDAYTHATNHV